MMMFGLIAQMPGPVVVVVDVFFYDFKLEGFGGLL